MEEEEHQHELFPFNQEEQLQSLSQSQITAAVELSLLYSDSAEPIPLQDLTAHAEDMTPPWVPLAVPSGTSDWRSDSPGIPGYLP